MRAEIYRIRSMAYLFLNQYQFGLDDATAGFKLLSAFIQQIQTKCLENIPANYATSEFKKGQCSLLSLRIDCSKGLGDKDWALVDLWAAIALERQWGHILEYDLLQASIGECEREDLWWMQEGMVLRT